MGPILFPREAFLFIEQTDLSVSKATLNCLTVCLSRVNFHLAITFKPEEIGLSYYTCVFLVARPFDLH